MDSQFSFYSLDMSKLMQSEIDYVMKSVRNGCFTPPRRTGDKMIFSAQNIDFILAQLEVRNLSAKITLTPISVDTFEEMLPELR